MLRHDAKQIRSKLRKNSENLKKTVPVKYPLAIIITLISANTVINSWMTKEIGLSHKQFTTNLKM